MLKHMLVLTLYWVPFVSAADVSAADVQDKSSQCARRVEEAAIAFSFEEGVSQILPEGGMEKLLDTIKRRQAAIIKIVAAKSKFKEDKLSFKHFSSIIYKNFAGKILVEDFGELKNCDNGKSVAACEKAQYEICLNCNDNLCAYHQGLDPAFMLQQNFYRGPMALPRTLLLGYPNLEIIKKRG